MDEFYLAENYIIIRKECKRGDSIIGGNECVFDEVHNGWAASDVREWLKESLEDDSGMTADRKSVV